MNKEDWEVKKLENCFEFIRNGANIKQDSFAKGFPITRIETLSNDVFNRDRLGYANIFETEKYKKYLLYDKDILMSHINSMKYLGRAVLYIKKSDEIIIHGMNLLNLRAIKSILRPEFACYYFGSRSFKSDIYKIAKKAVNQASFTISSLKNISIPIPPLPIQTQIVAELGELNAILDKKRKQLEELDTLAQATFYDMFGDPVLNDKGWEVKTMEKVCKQIFGGGTPSKSNSSYYDKGNILWVTPKDMKYKFITDSQVKITESGLENSSAKLAPKGAVLMVLRSGILKHTLPVAIAQTELTVNQDLKVFICSSSISNIYLYSCLKAYESYLLTNVRAVTADNIEFSIIKNLNIPLPPLILQHQFAERIEAIEAQKELINQSIKEVQLLFDYTMDKYFN